MIAALSIAVLLVAAPPPTPVIPSPSVEQKRLRCERERGIWLDYLEEQAASEVKGRRIYGCVWLMPEAPRQ